MMKILKQGPPPASPPRTSLMIKSVVTMKTLFALATWTFIQKVSFYALLAVMSLR